jgi:hypothetical protein
MFLFPRDVETVEILIPTISMVDTIETLQTLMNKRL